MHALLSILAHATPVALALAIVAALFAALRPARVEAAPAVAAPAPKPAPAEAPAVAHGGHAKGHNLDLFGGWPEGDVPPTPAEVKAQVHRVLKIRLYTQVSIRQLKAIHTATHPAKLPGHRAVATDAPAVQLNAAAALLMALDAEDDNDNDDERAR